MKLKLDYSDNNNNNLVFIQLIPENDIERELLDKNEDTDTIESFYRKAVWSKLGNDYSLLKVVDQSKWPKAAQVLVQKNVGLGS